MIAGLFRKLISTLINSLNSKTNNSFNKNFIYFEYQPPILRCSSNIVICGPVYGDKKYSGTFIIATDKLITWAFEHSKDVWSSNKGEQKAREFLPIWLSIENRERDLYFSLLDSSMRHVLMPYLYDFFLKGWVTVYCYQCHQNHNMFIENNFDHQIHGQTSKWVEEWLCPNGHILHHEHSELRWITRG